MAATVVIVVVPGWPGYELEFHERLIAIRQSNTEVGDEALSLARWECCSGGSPRLGKERREDTKDLATAGNAMVLYVPVQHVLHGVMALAPAIAWQRERAQLNPMGVNNLPVVSNTLPNQGSAGWTGQCKVCGKDLTKGVVA